MDPVPVLTISAIILGPILALIIQREVGRYREKRDRKLKIFRDLMASRATRLSPKWVEGVNAIEVEFYAKSGKDKKVIDAWRVYCDHLNYFPQTGDASQVSAWDNKSQELIVNLLYEMAQSLGYDYDKVGLKRNIYVPMGWGEIEIETHLLRKASLAVFSGSKPLKMSIEGPVEIAGENIVPPVQSQVLETRPQEAPKQLPEK